MSSDACACAAARPYSPSANVSALRARKWALDSRRDVNNAAYRPRQLLAVPALLLLPLVPTMFAASITTSAHFLGFLASSTSILMNNQCSFHHAQSCLLLNDPRMCAVAAHAHRTQSNKKNTRTRMLCLSLQSPQQRTGATDRAKFMLDTTYM